MVTSYKPMTADGQEFSLKVIAAEEYQQLTDKMPSGLPVVKELRTPEPPASKLRINTNPLLLPLVPQKDLTDKFGSYFDDHLLCQLCFGVDFLSEHKEELKEIRVDTTFPDQYTVYEMLPVACRRKIFSFGADVKLTLGLSAQTPELNVVGANAKIEGTLTIADFKYVWSVPQVYNMGILSHEPSWKLMAPDTVATLQFQSIVIVPKGSIQTSAFKVPVDVLAMVSRRWGTDPDIPVEAHMEITFEPLRVAPLSHLISITV
jgi:hypothetical protein